MEQRLTAVDSELKDAEPLKLIDNGSYFFDWELRLVDFLAVREAVDATQVALVRYEEINRGGSRQKGKRKLFI